MNIAARPKTILALALSTLSFALGATAQASGPDGANHQPAEVVSASGGAPARGYVEYGLAIARANPPALALIAGADHHRVLGTNELGEQTYLDVGGGFMASPAYVAPKVHLEVSPHPVVAIRVQYDLLAFYGANRGLLSFASRSAPFGESELSAGDARSGLGHKGMLQLKFHHVLGPALLRGTADAAYYGMISRKGDGDYYYESEHDTLVKQNDVIVTTRAEALLAVWHSGRDTFLFLGPLYEGCATIRTDLDRQRVGGTLVLTQLRPGTLGRPTVGLEAGVNVSDPNRAGQAYGMVALGTTL